jgi:hypothetical protein
MKLTNALTALALVATSAAATVTIEDWRDAAAGAINSSMDAAKRICDNAPKLRQDNNEFLRVATSSGMNAVSITRLCYENSEREVDLAGAKVSREQLEALVLRADAYLRQTNAYISLLRASGDEINRGQRTMGTDRLGNALTTGMLGVEAAAVYMGATARLAAFLETN